MITLHFAMEESVAECFSFSPNKFWENRLPRKELNDIINLSEKTIETKEKNLWQKIVTLVIIP